MTTTLQNQKITTVVNLIFLVVGVIFAAAIVAILVYHNVDNVL